MRLPRRQAHFKTQMNSTASKTLLYTTATITVISPSFLFLANTWYDQQRIALIFLIILFTAALLLERKRICVSTPNRTLILAIATIGVISSINAREKVWSLTEVALIIGCAAISLSIRNIEKGKNEIILISILFTLLIKTIQTLTAYFSFLASDSSIFEKSLFFDGFSNIRFFGQFQTFTIPLLAIPLIINIKEKHARKVKITFITLLATWWAIAFFNGTRGTFLGLIFCILTLPLIINDGIKWSTIQLKAAILGIPIYFLLFKILPTITHSSLGIASNRDMTSLSLRDVIWRQAIGIIIDNPWLGIGPMGLSNIHYNKGVAAHPHQAILQIAAEWGIPASILFLTLTIIYFIRSVKSANREQCPVKTCILAALICAGAQSMVDGIIVTPYSQQLLAMLIPLTLNTRCLKQEKTTKPNTKLIISLLIASSIILTYRAFVDQDRLKIIPTEALSLSGNLQPRFWCQGITP